MADLPRTFRPKWAPRVVYPIAGLLLAAFVLLAVRVPGGPQGYGFADRAGLVLVGVAMAWFLHRLASVRIRCTGNGVHVRNILRSRDLEWAEVLDVRLEPSAPWVVLDLSDGTALAAMGIQGSDKEHAWGQTRELAALVAQQTPTRDE